MVGDERRITQERCVKSAKDFGAMVVQILDQLHVVLQAQFGQQLQRRRAQELREPGVEGAHLHRPAIAQNAVIECRELRLQSNRVGFRQAPRDQRFDARLRCRCGRAEVTQPLGQPISHLARRLAREGDRENFVRRRTVEQGTQDARHQHPRFARARARLDDNAATRIAGDGVERLAVDALAVGLVGCLRHVDVQ